MYAAQMYVGTIQEGPMKVEKWDDELAIRLSAEVVAFMGLQEGDEVDIRVSGPDTFDIGRTQGNERIFVRLRKANARGSEERD
jgi:antitoxin component of MazEF toxin-antitoxin module